MSLHKWSRNGGGNSLRGYHKTAGRITSVYLRATTHSTLGGLIRMIVLVTTLYYLHSVYVCSPQGNLHWKI